jgi:hypothetical protein
MGCFGSKETADEVSDLPSHLAGNAKNKSLVVPDGADGYVYGDTDGETMFFDAKQSFSEIIEESISYPPARNMPQTRGASFLHPSTMLFSTRTSQIGNSKDEKGKGEASTQSKQSLSKGGVRQSVIDMKTKLGKVSGGFVSQGYPGDLTEEELEACLKFRDELKRRDPAYREMVHAYAPAETEEFALCKFLRARSFDVDAVFAMLDENNAVAIWNEAKEKNFYETLEESYNGCPAPVFMKLFPIVMTGLAKNGAPLLYTKPGLIDVEALECVTGLIEIAPFFWHMVHYQGKESMLRELKQHDPETTVVLTERVIVLDMKGIPTALFDTEFLKKCSTISSCFPESMNRTYLLNVPTAFTFIWGIVKLFLDPRTVKKVGFFSRQSKAQEDLLNLVDENDLISDYGGKGPSFDDVLSMRQKDYGLHDRYVVKKLTITSKESDFSINLAEGEKIVSILVFSKGDNGAKVCVKKPDGTILIEPTIVKRKDGVDKKAHHSAELDTSKLPAGPGSMKVEATGSHKEHYLVAVCIKAQ